jgi:HEAT repeat protein
MNLDQLRNRIESRSEDERYSAWLELYGSRAPEALEEIKKIITGADPLLKITLARFLAQMHESKAVHYLVELLEDETPEVFEGARIAFEKNLFPFKLDVLFPRVKSKSRDARYYAIEKLATARKFVVVDPLIELLHGPDEIDLLVALSALRFLPHRGLVPHLIPLLSDPREEVRFRTILVFDALNENYYLLSRKVFFVAFRDLAPRVRHAAIWSLRKTPTSKSIRYLTDLSLNDADPMIRQEALLALGAFPTSSVMTHLLTVLVKETVVMVSLKAEAVLLRMPYDALFRGLKKNLNHKNNAVASKALSLLADLKIHKSYTFSYIRKALGQSKDDKRKIHLIESLGRLGVTDAIPILEAFITQSPILGYTAMLALVRLYPTSTAEPLVKTMINPKINIVIKQIIMKHLIRHGSKMRFPQTLVQSLLSYLKDPNLQMRYLACEALQYTSDPSILEHLFETLLKETDATIIKRITTTLVAIFRNNPANIPGLFELNLHNQAAVAHLVDILRSYCETHEQTTRLLRELLSGNLRLLDTAHRAHMLDLIWFLLNKHLITLNELLALMDRQETIEGLLRFLITQLHASKHISLELPFGQLNQLMSQDNPELQQLVIELSAYANSLEAIPLIVKSLNKPGLDYLQKPGVEAIRHLAEQYR